MRQVILYKQRQKAFAVASNIKQFKIPQYNALRDPFLIGYFDNPAIKKHLKETGIVTKKKFRVNKSTSKRPYSTQRPNTTQLYKNNSNTSRQTHPLKLPELQDYLTEHKQKKKSNYSKHHNEENSKEIKKTKRKSLSVNKTHNQQNKMWNSMKNDIKIGQIQKQNIQNQEQLQEKQNKIQSHLQKKQKFQENIAHNKIIQQSKKIKQKKQISQINQKDEKNEQVKKEFQQQFHKQQVTQQKKIQEFKSQQNKQIQSKNIKQAQNKETNQLDLNKESNQLDLMQIHKDQQNNELTEKKPIVQNQV